MKKKIIFGILLISLFLINGCAKTVTQVSEPIKEIHKVEEIKREIEIEKPIEPKKVQEKKPIELPAKKEDGKSNLDIEPKTEEPIIEENLDFILRLDIGEREQIWRNSEDNINSEGRISNISISIASCYTDISYYVKNIGNVNSQDMTLQIHRSLTRPPGITDRVQQDVPIQKIYSNEEIEGTITMEGCDEGKYYFIPKLILKERIETATSISVRDKVIKVGDEIAKYFNSNASSKPYKIEGTKCCIELSPKEKICKDCPPNLNLTCNYNPETWRCE